jgi:sugar/nucleoside kinase (ribokinase family)
MSDHDTFHMGRSSIDLHSDQIGAPFPEIESFSAFVGGSSTNISVGCARLGNRSVLLTGFGDDPVADSLASFLEREGVDIASSPRRSGRRSVSLTHSQVSDARVEGESGAAVGAIPVEVVNVLGVGDAFAGGLLHGRGQGWDWYRVARRGNACGAMVVLAHGCANSMPTWDEVAAFVDERGGW